MTLGMAMRVAAAAWLIQPAAPRDTRSLPDPSAFLEAVRVNLERSQDDQKLFAYKERRTELNLNPFGRLGTTGQRVREVTPIEDGSAVTIRLLERDGKPVTDGTPVRRPMRMSTRGRTVVDDVAESLDVSINRRDRLDGRDAIVAVFKAKRDANPRTREGRIVRSFAGEIWIDEETREVSRVQATAVDDVVFGYGMLARLNKGATVMVRRERIEPDLWLPVSIRFDGEGRALLFRKLTINFAVDWFDYRRTIK